METTVRIILHLYNFVFSILILSQLCVYFSVKLSNDGCAVRCPRISPDGKYLIWLERAAGGAHHNAHRLMYLDLDSHNLEVVTY